MESYENSDIDQASQLIEKLKSSYSLKEMSKNSNLN